MLETKGNGGSRHQPLQLGKGYNRAGKRNGSDDRTQSHFQQAGTGDGAFDTQAKGFRME